MRGAGLPIFWQCPASTWWCSPAFAAAAEQIPGQKRWKIPLYWLSPGVCRPFRDSPSPIRRAAVVFTLSLLAEAVDRQADGPPSWGWRPYSSG